MKQWKCSANEEELSVFLGQDSVIEDENVLFVQIFTERFFLQGENRQTAVGGYALQCRERKTETGRNRGGFIFSFFFFFYLAYCLFWFSCCFFRTFCYVAEGKQSFKPPSRLISADPAGRDTIMVTEKLRATLYSPAIDFFTFQCYCL